MDAVELARYLVGKVVVHDVAAGRLSGRIVETEAYPIGDQAGHAYRGRTARNRSLFLTRGHAYVYLVYGSSFMLTVTSEVRGVGGGVLLRALEPLGGIDLMQRSHAATRLTDLARGPGRLAEAMQIDLETRWPRFVRRRSTLSRGDSAESRRHRQEYPHWPDPQHRSTVAVL